MSRTTFGPRQRALIEKAAEKGPWLVTTAPRCVPGMVRNAAGECPVRAAVGILTPRGAGLRRSSFWAIIYAADDPRDPRRPELLRLLGVKEATDANP